MKAWHLTETTGFGALREVELDNPAPGPGEAVVRLRAVSLNSRDLAIARGTYRGGPGMAPPFVPVSDGAGEIETLGDGKTDLKIGDKVAITFFPNWLKGPPIGASFGEAFGAGGKGMLAEKILVPASALVPVPDGYSFEEAASLPCAAVTAWNALHGPRPLQAGQTVLTLGTGGVSIFAVQFARALGAEVVATTGADEKRERLKSLGASAVINYRQREDWDAAVLEATQGRGADFIVEVGGPGTLERSIDAAAVGGQVSLIGVLSGPKTINPLGLWRKSAIARGIFVGSREMFVAMNKFIEEQGIRPAIDEVFEFAAARDAYEHLASGKHFGKVCIRI